MKVKNIYFENIILPASDFVLGQSISRDLKKMMKSQWWSRDEIDEYQNYNLRKLIRHSFENVTYFNELFKRLKLTPADIKSKADLSKLPILTKEEIRRNYPHKIIARNLPDSDFISGSSSGSTGEPIRFYETKKSSALRKAAGIRSLYWMNYSLGDKYIKISRRSRESLIKKAQDLINRCTYLYFDELNEDIFLSMIKTIESVDPKFIRCYPVPLYYMAEIIEKRGGIKLNNLEGISTTASTLHKYMRDKIEKVFNVKIHDSCSCEGSAVFAQCENLEHYHPSEEYAISEFIEDEFSRNDADHAKRLITTELFNYALPFIRYDTQDYYVVDEEKTCSCGRSLLNISKIKGRDSDIFLLPSGKFLIEEDFFQFFDEMSAVNQFQVYQEKQNLLHIRLVTNNKFNESIKNSMYKYWETYLGKDIEFTISIVDRIELTPSGKHRILIRNPEITLPK